MMNVPETLYDVTSLIDSSNIPYPRMATIIGSYMCNQDCYYCYIKNFNNEKMAKKDELIYILNQLKKLKVKSIDWRGGEILLIPEIEEIFECANQLGFKQGLSTNGVLFNGSIMETFINVGTYVRFSLDTVDIETYKSIRGKNDCTKVLENIFQTAVYRKHSGSLCEISVKIGLAREITLNRIQEVLQKLRGWSIDNIQIKNLWDDKGVYYNDNIKKKDLIKLDQCEQVLIKKNRYAKFMSEPCFLTPTQIVIDAFGDIYLCPYFMNRKNNHLLGNIFQSPIEKLWGSEEHLKKLRSIKIHECLKHDCRFQKYMFGIRKLQKTGICDFV